MIYEANYITVIGKADKRRREDSEFYRVDKDSFMTLIEDLQNEDLEQFIPLNNVVDADKKAEEDLIVVEFWSGNENSSNNFRNQEDTWALFYNEDTLERIKAEFK